MLAALRSNGGPPNATSDKFQCFDDEIGMLLPYSSADLMALQEKVLQSHRMAETVAELLNAEPMFIYRLAKTASNEALELLQEIFATDLSHLQIEPRWAVCLLHLLWKHLSRDPKRIVGLLSTLASCYEFIDACQQVQKITDLYRDLTSYIGNEDPQITLNSLRVLLRFLHNDERRTSKLFHKDNLKKIVELAVTASHTTIHGNASAALDLLRDLILYRKDHMKPFLPELKTWWINLGSQSSLSNRLQVYHMASTIFSFTDLSSMRNAVGHLNDFPLQLLRQDDSLSSIQWTMEACVSYMREPKHYSFSASWDEIQNALENVNLEVSSLPKLRLLFDILLSKLGNDGVPDFITEWAYKLIMQLFKCTNDINDIRRCQPILQRLPLEKAFNQSGNVQQVLEQCMLDLETVKSDLAQAEKDKSDLRSIISSLDKKWEVHIHKLQEQWDMHQSESVKDILQLQNILQQKESEQHTIVVKMNDLEMKNISLRNENQTLKTQAQSAEKSSSLLKEKERECEKLKLNLSEMESEIRSSLQLADYYNKRLALVEKESERRQDQIQESEKKYQKLLEEREASFSLEREQLRALCSTYEMELESIKRENETFRDQIQDLESSLNEQAEMSEMLQSFFSRKSKHPCRFRSAQQPRSSMHHQEVNDDSFCNNPEASLDALLAKWKIK